MLQMVLLVGAIGATTIGVIVALYETRAGIDRKCIGR